MGVRWVEMWEKVAAFIEMGGDVLIALFAVTLLMWTLIFERGLYALFWHRQRVRAVVAAWQARADRSSWYAEQVRRMLISQVRHSLDRALPFVKTLIAVCPLLGLLGTVSGMIEVFDVMAISGNGNPRAMASGVSKATIPTMAGMVAALSGMYFSVQLQRYAVKETQRVEVLLVPLARSSAEGEVG